MTDHLKEALASEGIAALRAAALELARAAAAIEKALGAQPAAPAKPAESAAPAAQAPAPTEPPAPEQTPGQLRAALAAEMAQVVARQRVPQAKAAIASLGAARLSDIPDDRLAEARVLIAEVMRAE